MPRSLCPLAMISKVFDKLNCAYQEHLEAEANSAQVRYSEDYKCVEFLCDLNDVLIVLCGVPLSLFPLGDFVRAMRGKNKNSATWLVKIGWRKKSPRTSRNRSYFFLCSCEQIRQVENGL